MTGVQTALLLDAPEPATARHRQRRAERARTMDSLQHGRHEAEITLARQVARELCELHGETTATRLRAEMVRRGYVRADEKETRWVGGVFFGKHSGFVRTGQYVPEGSHGSMRPVWKLA
jgi:hypothetical protein